MFKYKFLLFILIGIFAVGLISGCTTESGSDDTSTEESAALNTDVPTEEAPDPTNTPRPTIAPTVGPTQAPTVVAMVDENDLHIDGGWYFLNFTNPETTREMNSGSPIEEQIIELINDAKVSIDGAFFEFNVQSVTDALIAAHERGVKVRLVLDDEHTIEDEESTFAQLEAAGIPFLSDNRSALMHHKFMIIDSSILWMGSMNFTENGIYRNNNNTLMFRSTRLVQNYQGEFDEMFVNGVFTTRDDKYQPNRQITVNDILIETYFAPEDGNRIEQRLVELINNAESRVRIMTFVLTLDSIGNALIDRHNAGVDVQGIFELRGSLQGQMLPMLCAGIPARQDSNPNTMHHKVMIIDDIVVTGSFNFSASARDDNSENLLIIYSPELANHYMDEFNRVYGLGREVPEDDRQCN